MLDPELELAASVQPKYDFSDPAPARRTVARLSAALMARGFWSRQERDVAYENRTIPRADGTALPLRIYRPRHGLHQSAPAVVYFHGGGFMVGNLDFEHGRCLDWAAGASAVVISCDYRLSPEDRYPAAIDDCYDCLNWVATRAGELGLDRHRLAVAGSSCGGALAAGVALRARDTSGPDILFQLLIYPVLDNRMTTDSMNRFVNTPGWDRDSNAQMWSHYLPEGRKSAPCYAAPARARDLSGLPRAYIMTAEMDPLRDEGLSYALRLLRAGVSTELHNFAGTYHAFDTVRSSNLARRAIDEQIAALQRAFGSVTPLKQSDRSQHALHQHQIEPASKLARDLG